MVEKTRKLPAPVRVDDKRIFWGVLLLAVILTSIGIWLGNPFEDYQTASTL